MRDRPITKRDAGRPSWTGRLLSALPTLICLGLLVPIALPLVHAATTPPGPPPWKVVLPFGNIPEGQPFSVIVSGPASTYFTLNLTEPPFNESFPLFLHTYETSKGIHNGTVGFLNTTLNDTSYNVGHYQLALQVQGVTESVALLNLISPVNVTALNDTVTQLYYQVYIQQQEIAGLNYQVQNLEGQVPGLFVGILADAALFAGWNVMLGWSRRNPARFRGIRLWFRRWFLEPRFRPLNRATLAIPHPVPAEDAVYYARFPDCTTCSGQARLTWPAITRHVSEVHKRIPLLGANIFVDKSVVQRIQATTMAKRREPVLTADEARQAREAAIAHAPNVAAATAKVDEKPPARPINLAERLREADKKGGQ